MSSPRRRTRRPVRWLLALALVTRVGAADGPDCYSTAVALARAEARLDAARAEVEAASAASHALLASLVPLPPEARERTPTDWGPLEAHLLEGGPAPAPAAPSAQEQAVTAAVAKLAEADQARLGEAGQALHQATVQAVTWLRVTAPIVRRLRELGGCAEARAATRGQPFGGAFPGHVAGQKLSTPARYDLLWAPDAGAYVGRVPLTLATFARAQGRKPEVLPVALYQQLGVSRAEDPIPWQDPEAGPDLCGMLQAGSGELPPGWSYRSATREGWAKLAATPGLEQVTRELRHVRCVLAPE